MKKYTVITGASSGIGYDTAKAFAARGKHLILIARREDKLHQLKVDIQMQFPSLEIVVIPFDLTNTQQIEGLFGQLDDYFIETWINNAGFGHYGLIKEQTLARTIAMMQLNVEAVTLLSILYVQKYHNVEGTQLINISSAGGYTMVPTAVSYCATKFYVSSFTEGLALELRQTNSPLQAKVLAPAATQTEFGKVANNREEYNYEQAFGTYHTSEEMAQFLLELYESNEIVGFVDRETFSFVLSGNKFSYTGSKSVNQRLD
uniref:SDR family NAD(P)-dependent oxidoreductase n=1 Tax=Candidatus Enterococcus willemsii TaxID=1857215 RepID=UPI00403F273A